MSRNTFARIDVAALGRNLARVKRLAPRSRLMAVVKADAYGHRLELCIPALDSADLLAVATLDEARSIRVLNNRLPILLLEGVSRPEALEELRQLNLELVVHHPSQLEMLEDRRAWAGSRIWLKLDSGMHRLGFPVDQAGELRRRLLDLPGIAEVVLMSHFACADEPGHALNARQLQRFDAAAAGLDSPHSLSNSAAILNLEASHRDWVRPGLLLYGISPLAGGNGRELDLDPVMHLQTELIAVNALPASESVGYGARFTAAENMRIGVAAIGYGDGYPRNMPDGAPVLVNGRRQRLVGAVSMDMVTVDLSDQPEARVGDPVTLWGPGLPVEEVARAAGTIPYELVCRVTRRVRFEVQ